MKKETQNKQILKHLKTGRSLTALEALNLCGTMRLASRVSELKSEGNNIVSQLVNRNGKWVARYSLVPSLCIGPRRFPHIMRAISCLFSD